MATIVYKDTAPKQGDNALVLLRKIAQRLNVPVQENDNTYWLYWKILLAGDGSVGGGGGGTWGSITGTLSDQTDLQTELTALENALVPVGSIVGVDTSLTGIPSVSAHWESCTGGVIVDADSPFNGLTTPVLNTASDVSRKFLRGHSVPGSSTASFNQHTHGLSFNSNGPSGMGGLYVASGSAFYAVDYYSANSHIHLVAGNTNAANSAINVPPAYGVNFHLRIK